MSLRRSQVTKLRRYKMRTDTRKELAIRKGEYYPKLNKLIEELGEWNINQSDLSREWNIPTTTIHRWTKQIVDQMDAIDLTEVGRNIKSGFLHNIKVCQRLILSEDKATRVAGIRTFNDTADHLNRFMENFGYKEKVAEKIENLGAPINIQINNPNDEYPNVEEDENNTVPPS